MNAETKMSRMFIGGGSKTFFPQYFVQMNRRWYFQVLIRLFLISLSGHLHLRFPYLRQIQSGCKRFNTEMQ